MADKKADLGLNRQQAEKLLSGWVDMLNSQPQFAADYKFDQGLDCTTGQATLFADPDRKSEVRVGVRHMAGITGKVKTSKFVQSAISLFHESVHVLQDHDRKLGVQSEATRPEQLASFAAYRNNPGLYQALQDVNLMELQAEQNGIGFACKMLRHAFPDADCEKLVLDAVNECNAEKNSNYWLGRVTKQPLASLDQLNEAYRTAAAEILTGHRASQAEKISGLENDELYRILRPDVDGDNPWKPFTDRIKFEAQLGDGAGFDRMLACVTLHAHPEYCRTFPALQPLAFKLSPRAVFGAEFPETAEQIKDRLAGMDGLDYKDQMVARTDAPPQPSRKTLRPKAPAAQYISHSDRHRSPPSVADIRDQPSRADLSAPTASPSGHLDSTPAEAREQAIARQRSRAAILPDYQATTQGPGIDGPEY